MENKRNQPRQINNEKSAKRIIINSQLKRTQWLKLGEKVSVDKFHFLVVHGDK